MMLAAGWIAFVAMNLFAFALYGIDKAKAKSGAWRIPEKTLLAAAWLLGGVGAWLGMRVFRHKTKHARFVYGVPLAALVSFALIVFFTVQMVRM